MEATDYKLSVLVISGNDDSRRSMAEDLRPYFQVIEATTGAGGLEDSIGDPDIILINADLPDMSGFEVCRGIRKNQDTVNIPVLHLSASAPDAGAKAKSVESGADGFLVMPVKPAALMGAVNSVMRTKNF